MPDPKHKIAQDFASSIATLKDALKQAIAAVAKLAQILASLRTLHGALPQDSVQQLSKCCSRLDAILKEANQANHLRLDLEKSQANKSKKSDDKPDTPTFKP